MIDFVLLPIEAIIGIHAELLAEDGGAPGLRDRVALEASLDRARRIIASAEEEVTLHDLAAAVCVGIVRTHPFVDGDERAGFAALGMMLNGSNLNVVERDATRVILDLAAGRSSEVEFRRWVALNCGSSAARGSDDELASPSGRRDPTVPRPIRRTRPRLTPGSAQG